MTTILVLCAVGALLWYFMFSGKGGSKSAGLAAPAAASTTATGRASSKTRESAALRTFNANNDWLKERWSDALQKQRSGDTSDFPRWYFDAATDRQLKWISEQGLELSLSAITKGQASDIIGLFGPPEESDAEILKFFKVPAAGMNQTRARAEVPKLMADPAKAEAWRQRPADALQKERLRFYGETIPKGLTYPEAEGIISRREVALASEESPLLDDWEHYSRIIEELGDRETCEDYGLKKPTIPVIRSAAEELRKEGQTMEALADDLDLIAAQIIKMKPELERRD